jgi:carotenoid 1,2-hydratase
MNLLSGIQQDFHRPQKSPGAYEWWHFDGADEKSGYAFSLQFFAGNLFSPYYQDSLKTYWQKTKSPLSPGALAKGNAGISDVPFPNPLDYCGVAFRIFHKGRMVGEALQEFSSKFLKASDRQGAVLLGPNRFNWDEKGDPPSYVITAQVPTRGGRLLRARLFFTPQTGDILNLPQPDFHSTHTWILAAPRCHVEGTLQWCDAQGEVDREQAFVGLGYHDHHFGSVPLDRFVGSWHWGRAFLGDETLVYSARTPAEGGAASGILLTLDPGEIQTWKVGFDLSSNRRNFFWLPYHKRIGFTGAHSLEIEHDQLLSDGPASLIFEDQVEWIKNGKGQKGIGMSNYLYTPRLSSRFFFPMLKGKTSVFIQKDGKSPSAPAGPGDVTTTRPEI